MYYALRERVHELLILIMAVLAKVGWLHICERLPSVLVDPCLYYCSTAHQALAALCSLCTESCARTVRSMCVGVRNVYTLIYMDRSYCTLRASSDRFF